MSNERIVIFNYSGKVKDLPKALEEAIDEIEKRLEEQEQTNKAKITLNSVYGESKDNEHNCYNCPDKVNCETLNKILFNDPIYGEYLKSIFDPRD